MIHTRTKVIALIALGFFLGSLVFFAGAFFILENKKEQLYEARYAAAEGEMHARALEALQASIDRSREDREKLKKLILEEESVIDLLSLLEGIARDQGVLFDTGLSTAPIDDFFEEVRFDISLEGSFDGVMRMIRILEVLPGQGLVPEVSLSRGGEGGEDAWSASLVLVVTKYKKI